MLSFQKSIELNKAGFPIPMTKQGQIWYDGNGNPWIVGVYGVSNPNELVFRALVGVSWEWPRDTAGFVFSPTETDILDELQKDCRRGFWWNLTPPLTDDKQWSCNNYKKDEGKVAEFLSMRPDEACANAYLHCFSKVFIQNKLK